MCEVVSRLKSILHSSKYHSDLRPLKSELYWLHNKVTVAGLRLE
jgi:hypothetical protein